MTTFFNPRLYADVIGTTNWNTITEERARFLREYIIRTKYSDSSKSSSDIKKEKTTKVMEDLEKEGLFI